MATQLPQPPRELWTLRLVPAPHPCRVSERLHHLLAYAAYHAGLRVEAVNTDLHYEDRTLTVTAATVTLGSLADHDSVVPPLALRVRKTLKYASRHLALRCVDQRTGPDADTQLTQRSAQIRDVNPPDRRARIR